MGSTLVPQVNKEIMNAIFCLNSLCGKKNDVVAFTWHGAHSKRKTHSTFSTCVFSSSSVSSPITCLFPQVQRSTTVEVSSHRILKQKKFTTSCTSTRTWASGPLKLTPWVEYTKRKSPLKLPSSQPPPRPPLSRGSKPSTQPTFRETSPSINFSNILSARPASSRANIQRSALSIETDSKGPTTQSTQSISREIPCDSNFSDLNPNLKNSSSFSSSPSASSSFCTSQDLGTVHERYRGLRTTLVCEEGPGHIPFKKSWTKKKEEEIKAQKNQKNSIHLENSLLY